MGVEIITNRGMRKFFEGMLLEYVEDSGNAGKLDDYDNEVALIHVIDVFMRASKADEFMKIRTARGEHDARYITDMWNLAMDSVPEERGRIYKRAGDIALFTGALFARESDNLRAGKWKEVKTILHEDNSIDKVIEKEGVLPFIRMEIDSKSDYVYHYSPDIYWTLGRSSFFNAAKYFPGTEADFCRIYGERFNDMRAFAMYISTRIDI